MVGESQERYQRSAGKNTLRNNRNPKGDMHECYMCVVDDELYSSSLNKVMFCFVLFMYVRMYLDGNDCITTTHYSLP